MHTYACRVGLHAAAVYMADRCRCASVFAYGIHIICMHIRSGKPESRGGLYWIRVFISYINFA